MYAAQLETFLSCLGESHGSYHASGVFGGPSLYFHKRALAEARVGEVEKFAEASYAMLASWGMHRMGSGGAKMTDFDTYAESLRKAWPALEALRGVTPSSLKEEDWSGLEKAFMSITAMQSACSLVANSKVLAHAVPDLVPPVDREYTIRFLHGHKQLPKQKEGEWKMLRQFLEHFFYPALEDDRFQAAYRGWDQPGSDLPWNTSQLKTVDNLVVGYVRSHR